MEYYRTHDYASVRNILTHEEVFPFIGDDYSPFDPEEFEVNEDPRIWYVMARTSSFQRVALFSLIPQNHICWEVHVVILPGTGTTERWNAARELIPWLKYKTECERLVAQVPAGNRPAIVYGTHGLGLRYVGRHSKAFMKNGELQDLVLLGRSVNE